MTRSKSSPLGIVFLTVFIDLLGFGIVIPLLPLYAERYQPSPMAFGLLMSSFSAMQFVFAPLLGRLSDRVGRRPVLLASLLGSVASYVVFAFAHSLAMLFLSRIMAGVMGANIGTAQAVIADVTERDQRARGMGLIGMAFGLGFVFGPAIGGFTVKVSETLPGLAAAGLSFVAFVWTFLRLPETRPVGAARAPRPRISFRLIGGTLRRPIVGPVLFVSFLATLAFANFEATFAQFLRSRFGSDPSTVAWLFVLLGGTAAIVQGGLIRRLAPRFGETRLVIAGTLLLGAAFLGLVVTKSHAGLIGLIVAMAVGNGLAGPSLMALVSRASEGHEQGEVLGSVQAMSSLGRIVGPFWGENVYLRFGALGPYGTGALIEVAAVLLSVFRLPVENRAPAGDGVAPGGTAPSD